MKKTFGVVMAAGLGTRMKSDQAKVLHRVLGVPMVSYALDALRGAGAKKTAVVVGHQAERVKAALAPRPDMVFSIQAEQRGTADAFRAGLRGLGRPDGTILVVSGDMPLLDARTLRTFLSSHRRKKSQLTIGTFVTERPGAYGRVLKDAKGAVTGIVEFKDATEAQKAIREVNGGIYAVEPVVLPLLGKIQAKNRAGEYYLTDLVGLAVQAGLRVRSHELSEEDLMGVNSRVELERVSRILRRRIARQWMDAGVTVMDPETTTIPPGMKIGRDTVIYPGVILEGVCRIGKSCVLYPGVRILDSTLADGVEIKDSSLIEESKIGSGCAVGPFAHLRPGSVLKENVKVGNFVELKKAQLGAGTKASHLSYLGDAVLGRNVNVGAGTITCNYDGKKKHVTTIGDGVFVGSDTQIVAPVRVGRGAYIGAGSTVVSDVPADALAVSRVRQRNVEGWARRKKKSGKRREKAAKAHE